MRAMRVVDDLIVEIVEGLPDRITIGMEPGENGEMQSIERDATLADCLPAGYELAPAGVEAGWVSDGAGGFAPPVPEPPPPAPALTRIAKADIWRRLTDEEAEAVDAALQAAPLRLRRIFEAAQYLDTADDDYPALRAAIVAALGEERGAEVLAPTY